MLSCTLGIVNFDAKIENSGEVVKLEENNFIGSSILFILKPLLRSGMEAFLLFVQELEKFLLFVQELETENLYAGLTIPYRIVPIA
jgi:hypothetical protein